MKKKRVSGKSLVSLFACTILLLAIIAGVAWMSKDNTKQPSQGQSPTQTEETPIVAKGQLVCLSHEGNPEVTTMECAYGFKADEGKQYSVKDSDPQGRNLHDIPFNKPILIKGTVSAEDPNSVYESAGKITVTEVTQL